MNLIVKIRKRFWSKIVKHAVGKSFYPWLYPSYWHFVALQKKRDHVNHCKQYFTSIPNPGAGIGHQMANWIAGYWFAKFFKLNFAHIPFSNPTWEKFLGFSQGEELVSELKSIGYKTVHLPLFDENSTKDIDLVAQIIHSYRGKKIVFVAELDQFYQRQFDVIEDLKQKFYSAPFRKTDRLIYSKNDYNIAVHIRRGDIMRGLVNQNANLLSRIQSNSYFINVLKNTLQKIKVNKTISIYLFSQSTPEELSEFQDFKNLTICNEMSANESFLHMVHADCLITSKSSFSYKPALLSNGIKICPKKFWHGYPNSSDWILVDENGNFSQS
jgi:hypothetical protein